MSPKKATPLAKGAASKKATPQRRSQAATPAKGKQSAAKSASKRTPSAAKAKKNVDKYIRYPDEICTNDFVNPEHDALYRDSIENQADFFEREAD